MISSIVSQPPVLSKQICILGCDAHQPEALGRKELQAEILELLKKYGIQVLDTVPLRHI